MSKDTRFDRVSETVRSVQPLPKIELFKQHSFVLVAGSSYSEEANLINRFLDLHPDTNIKIIIAPHEIDQAHLDEVKNLFSEKSICFYSTASDSDLFSSKVLVIDNIGLLSSIYQYASIALIGGGFGRKGLHNTLEAATFGMPILFGPNNHQKFPESIQLIENGSAFTIHNSDEFEKILLEFITDKLKLEEVSLRSKTFINSNTGATDVILSKLTF